MPPRTYSTKFVIFAIIASIALHAMLVAAVYLMPTHRPLPLPLPVDLVNLPREILKKLPPLDQPQEPPARPPLPSPKQAVPEKPLPPTAVPRPKKFGADDEVTLPQTGKPPASSVPEGLEQGKEAGKPDTGKTGSAEEPKQTGPLPFLSRKDIDELARKGMPAPKPGDDSVTLDTDEFKFLSYNRWLKIKVESNLKYPELAAVSGYQGTLFIQFTIRKDGSLGGFEVLKSSGYKILDDEAERSIRASAPFEPLPVEWKMEHYSVRAAVIFFLGQGYLR